MIKYSVFECSLLLFYVYTCIKYMSISNYLSTYISCEMKSVSYLFINHACGIDYVLCATQLHKAAKFTGVLAEKNKFQFDKALGERQPLTVQTSCTISTLGTVATRWRVHPSVAVAFYQCLNEP